MEGRIFFVGLVILVLGLLILVYDYPQMIYIQNVTTEQLELFDRAEIDKFKRIQIEFYVGVGILLSGAVILFFSRFRPAMFNKKI